MVPRMKAFTKSYTRKKVNKKLDLMNYSNLGFYNHQKVHINSVYFRNKKELLPMSKWKFIKKVSRATFFELPNKKIIIVNPELVSPAYGTMTARDKTNQRRQVLLIHELLKRKVDMEIPVGYFKTKEGQSYYVIYAKKGTPLPDKLEKSTLQEKNRIAKQLAQKLAEIHNKGVAHGHPWLKNWIINDDGVHLIDTKMVLFKDDFPHTSKSTSRKIEWNEITKTDLNALLSEYKYNPEQFEIIKKEYKKHIK